MCLIWIEVRHLPILTPIQINAWNINKPAIIMTQICNKSWVMKPSTWMIFHGSNSWQLQISVATKYVNNSRIIKFWILCFHSVCHSAWPRYKILQGHYFIAPPSNTCSWGNHNLNACNTTSSYGFQAFCTFANLVLYHPWLCSNILKPTLHFFLQSGHLNRYMHHHSLAQAEPLIYGEI